MGSQEDLETEARSRREAWLKRLAEEMEKLELLFPLQVLPAESDTPEWVQRLEWLIAQSMLPAAKLKKGRELTPKRMGSLIGHQCGNAVWMMEWFAAQADRADVPPAHVGRNSTEDNRKRFAGIFEKWYPAMRRYAKRSLCSSVDQSYEDMSAFLQGFADGFARKPRSFEVGSIGTMSFEPYIYMAWAWRVVRQLRSTAELHQLLVRVFGQNRVGELKRVEKICQRIGLQFRKPGRPRKSE